MLSSAQCPCCGNPTLVTQNVKADVIQRFCGPHTSSSMPPKPKVSRVFKKASFGSENGCPGWEEMRLESPPAAALSSNTALFFLGLHASKSPCPQSPIARIRAAPHIISISFPVAGGFQVPWYSRTPRVYTQDRGGICPWRGQWG